MLQELHDVQTILQDIEAAIGERVEQKIAARRDYEKKSTGTIHAVIDGMDVKSVVPKRVEWDQDKLEEAIAELELEYSITFNPAEYVDYTMKISEEAYGRMPPHVKRAVDRARIVKHGKERIELTRIKND